MYRYETLPRKAWIFPFIFSAKKGIEDNFIPGRGVEIKINSTRACRNKQSVREIVLQTRRYYNNVCGYFFDVSKVEWGLLIWHEPVCGRIGLWEISVENASENSRGFAFIMRVCVLPMYNISIYSQVVTLIRLETCPVTFSLSRFKHY